MASIGQRDKRLRIEKATKLQNPDTGEVTLTWALLREVWASTRPLNTRELMAAAQLVAKETQVFNVDYNNVRELDPFPNPNEDVRLVYRGQVWNIEGTISIGRDRELDILATARAEAA